MTPPARVGRTAFLLGFAGLLPQAAAVFGLVQSRHDEGAGAALGVSVAYLLAVTYAAVILSFLGGVWWGLAMRREQDQTGLVVAAVVPSLVAAAMLLLALLGGQNRLPLFVLGIATLATLAVDHYLSAGTGEAPAGWMRLRAPLSLGLGVLTIAAGALVDG